MHTINTPEHPPALLTTQALPNETQPETPVSELQVQSRRDQGHGKHLMFLQEQGKIPWERDHAPCYRTGFLPA